MEELRCRFLQFAPTPRARRRSLLSLLETTIVLALFCGLGGSQPANSAGPRTPSENEVKAAFLLNFTKFIDWPEAEAAADGAFSICVLGEDPFGPVLDQTMQGESVNGRPIAVRRVARGGTKPCQILYFTHPDKDIKELESLGPGVLTVGEGDLFLRGGGMIAFLLDSRRVRFSVNLSATLAGRLKLSSRLLAVAKSVEK